MTNAAFIACGDVLDCCVIGNDSFEPSTATGNRSEQCSAALDFDRSGVRACDRQRQQNFTWLLRRRFAPGNKKRWSSLFIEWLGGIGSCFTYFRTLQPNCYLILADLHGEKMTTSNDRDPAMRRRTANDTNYTPWIFGGIVGVALIVGAYYWSNDNVKHTELNSNRDVTTTVPVTPPLNSPASTTGSSSSTMNAQQASAATTGPAPADDSMQKDKSPASQDFGRSALVHRPFRPHSECQLDRQRNTTPGRFSSLCRWSRCDGITWVAQEAKERCCDHSCLIITPDWISERPPRGGLSVSHGLLRMSACGCKADIAPHAKCPLVTKNGNAPCALTPMEPCSIRTASSIPARVL